ncbi:MAG: hypothetical protein ABEJ66_02000 [Candidatus Nanohaloarchaea archaeon]
MSENAGDMELDLSQDRIDNGVEELAFALGEEQERVEEYVRDYVREETGGLEFIDMDSYLGIACTTWAQGLGEDLRDDELRQEFYSQTLDQKFEYLLGEAPES